MITWNLRSKYITKAEAIAGLGPLASTAGPTGLRSWVVLPNHYNTNRCWPVLYLLHAAGVANEWLGQQAYFRDLPAIVVIPGGGDGQYSDWYDGGARSPGWEKWFFDELVPKVSKSFSVCPGRRFHAVAGPSMGGFGALYLSSQRPDYFGTAASFSGVIAISDPVIEFGFSSYQYVWGPPGGFYELGHDPVYLLPNLVHTRLFVDVGNGTAINPSDLSGGGQKALLESVMRHQASVFVAAAHRDHVNVHFTENPGVHSMDQWVVDLSQLIAQGLFARVSDNPTSWRFTTTNQVGTAWNYRFSFARPPESLETFTDSNGVIRGTGSGRLTLITPNGRRLQATMPFVLRKGLVRLGHSGVPVYNPSSLPVPVTLRSDHVGRRASLVATFKARRLSPGNAYQLTAFQALHGNCSLSSVSAVPDTSAGHTVVVRVRPGVAAGHPKNRWCRGAGTVNLAIVQKQDTGQLQIGRLVGQAEFTAR